MKISEEQKNEYGQRILTFRTYLGMTLEVFSRPLSVGFKTVSNYERGNAKPSEAVIRQLEDIYLMNRNWFETGKGDMQLPVSKDPTPVYAATKHVRAIRADQEEVLDEWDRLTREEQKIILANMKHMRGRKAVEGDL